ncbi:MAG TPA: cytochrome c [Anaerolineales bacterium]|nr:cytochrome c [Anaerolineales bacterium]
MSLAKRVVITLAILATPFILGLLITYQVIKIDWISFMEIQPSFRAQEAPLPVPRGAVPIQGAAFVPGAGEPENPVAITEESLARGQHHYELNCALCHGSDGAGAGPLADHLRRQPANLGGQNTTQLSDGSIFMVVTYGIPGLMPALKENLDVGDRWDVVNYVRQLQNP